MKLVWFLFRSNTKITMGIMFLGLVSGAASASLVAILNSALYGSSRHWPAWALPAAFLTIVLVKVSTSLAATLVLGHNLQEIMLNLCSSLCRKIAGTPLRRLEEIGPARIMTSLTDDVALLSNAVQALPTVVANLAILISCTLYLAWISPMAAIALVLLVSLVGVIYRLLMVQAMAAIQRAREGRDVLFRHFRALVEGIKELKLHRERQKEFFEDDVDRAADLLRRENVIAMNRYAIADGWSQFTFYALLGLIAFGFPAVRSLPLKTLTAYIFIALYMMSPIWGVIGTIPSFSRGQASLEKLEGLGFSLADIHAAPADTARGVEELGGLARSGEPPLIEFRDVAFRYGPSDDRESFSVGPINLTLQPNELVFIIGGNGSGKSTLAKLLTGLYTPESGAIWVDGQPIKAAEMDSYRQLFSTVYSDFYIFDRLLGLSQSKEVVARAHEYLAALDLKHKVELEGRTFSTTALSQGQRRRLALLCAYMEDRPVYVLDEWAADQDPEFRRIFYTKLLPELRRSGKTVVVITHDDRYFHLGDCVVKLDYGRIIDVTRRDVPAESLRA
jgi:putative ATP-binding cassette transporter